MPQGHLTKLRELNKNKIIIYRPALLFLLISFIIMTGCSNKKDGFSYRVFHNTTAKYNGFFYAKESMKEIHSALEEEHEEDYDNILPIFIYSDEESLDALNAQTERIIEKTQKVIALHNMDISKRETKKMKRPEMNKWIDDNYLLLGQGYFYKGNYFKAEEFFKFITRKYEDDNIIAQAHNWLARVYVEKNQYSKAITTLNIAAKQKELEDEIVAETNMIFADIHIKKEEHKEAVAKLQKAISHIEKKKERARPTFILAQLNQKLGNSQQAITLYKEVVKMKPEYELVFYSKINQAMAFNRRGGNSDEIKNTLDKMLRDEKNLEYRDQIYYALAELALEERDQELGMTYLQRSIETSVNNQKQKAKSFLRLADIYFEDRMYPEAQAYYDSTSVNLAEDHPRYKRVKNMAESLGELVSNLNTIALQDSMSMLCGMSPEDRREKVKEIVKQKEKEMADKKFADELAAQQAASQADDANAGSGQFWPYNAYLKSVGRENFVSFWGERKLEDNWRRSQKSPSFSNPDEDTPEEDVPDFVDYDPYQVPTVDEILAELPCSSEQQSISDSLVAAAYYNNGLIYKEKLDDFDNGIDSWETLVGTMDDSANHPTAYYQLFRSFFKKEQEGYTNFGCMTCSSAYWAKIISDRYPGSEWDYLVKDPDYLVGKSLVEAQEQEKYAEVYRLYSTYKYIDVITESTKIIDEEPENHLICKYRLLKAQAIGNMDGMTGQRDNYIEELKSIPKNCPGSDEAKLAEDILKRLNGETADLGKEKPKKEDKKEDEEEPIEDSPFKKEEMIKHYVAVLIPSKEDLPIPVTEMKANISDYNKSDHQSSNLKVTSNLFGREYHIILVKTFLNADAARLYHSAFVENTEALKEINEGGYQTMLVSKDNYLTIFKERNLEDYVQFYLDNY